MAAAIQVPMLSVPQSPRHLLGIMFGAEADVRKQTHRGFFHRSTSDENSAWIVARPTSRQVEGWESSLGTPVMVPLERPAYSAGWPISEVNRAKYAQSEPFVRDTFRNSRAEPTKSLEFSDMAKRNESAWQSHGILVALRCALALQSCDIVQ